MAIRFTTYLTLAGLLLPVSELVQTLHLSAGQAHYGATATSGTDTCCHRHGNNDTPARPRHDRDHCAFCQLIAVTKTALAPLAPTTAVIDLFVSIDTPPPADRHPFTHAPTLRIPRAPPAIW